MPKIFDVIKTNDNAIAIAAASYRLITIPMPYECRLGAVIVKQVAAADGGGTAVPFKVDILNSKMQAWLDATPAKTVDADIAYADKTLPNNFPLYRIFDTKEGSAGAVVSEYTPAVGGDGYLFRNADGTSTEPVRKSYLLIRPTGAAGATKWEYAVTVVSDIGG